MIFLKHVKNLFSKLLDFLNKYANLIVGIATVSLVIVTYKYVKLTNKLLESQEKYVNLTEKLVNLQIEPQVKLFINDTDVGDYLIINNLGNCNIKDIKIFVECKLFAINPDNNNLYLAVRFEHLWKSFSEIKINKGIKLSLEKYSKDFSLWRMSYKNLDLNNSTIVVSITVSYHRDIDSKQYNIIRHFILHEQLLEGDFHHIDRKVNYWYFEINDFANETLNEGWGEITKKIIDYYVKN